MKKSIKIIGVTIVVVLIVAVVFTLFVNIRGIPHYTPEKISYQVNSNQESIQRGKKLALSLCANCHLNRETGKLTGILMKDVPPEFGKIYSANITKDKTYGIGNWKNSEIVYLLRTGIKKDGQYAPPYMAKLPLMADNDINAIISFLNSDDRMVYADATPDHPCEPSILTKFLSMVAFKPLPFPTEPIPMPDTSNQVEFGKYLALNFDCYSCHSADFKTNNFLEPEKSEGFFGGGNKPLNLDGQIVLTSNLTPDQETGIGLWTKEQFVKAVKSGIVDGQSSLQYPMLPYVHLTDKEAEAIFAYLQTIPAIKNKVERVIY